MEETGVFLYQFDWQAVIRTRKQVICYALNRAGYLYPQPGLFVPVSK